MELKPPTITRAQVDLPPIPRAGVSGRDPLNIILGHELETFTAAHGSRVETEIGGIKLSLPAGVKAWVDQHYDLPDLEKLGGFMRSRAVFGGEDGATRTLIQAKSGNTPKQDSRFDARADMALGFGVDSRSVPLRFEVTGKTLTLRTEPSSLLEVTLQRKGKPAEVITSKADDNGHVVVDAGKYDSVSVRIADPMSRGAKPVWSESASLPVK